MKLQKALLIVFILLGASAGTVWADVGRVLFVMGSVTLETPVGPQLKRGDMVDEGGAIVTGSRGFVQLKLHDGSRISIRPGSRFIIEALEMPATETTPAIGAGKALRASFSLERGGFRTITGQIAQRSPPAYQVRTPSAVIRVRGTNYNTRYCQGECVAVPSGQRIDDGLYLGVSKGTVAMSNNGGDLELATNQYGYAQDFNAEPVRLIVPPAALSDGGLSVVLEEEDSDDAGEPEGEDEATDAEELASELAASEKDIAVAAADGAGRETADGPVEPDQKISAQTDAGTPVDFTSGRIDGVTDAVTQALVFSVSGAATSSNSSLEVDGNGALVSFQADDSDPGLTIYSIGTASNKNTGFDPITELRWGRWSEGVAQLQMGGTTAPLDVAEESLHWVVAPVEQLPTQTITGSADYLLVGNTDPTDNLGHIGVLGSASLSANFTTSSITSTLQLGIAGQVWTATGSGSINARLFSGLYSAITVDGASGGNGSFAGIFNRFNGSNAPGGAGMTYVLGSGPTQVTGAAVFNRSGSQ